MPSLSSFLHMLKDHREKGSDGFSGLFMVGFAAGVGVVLASVLLESQSSLTDRLRAKQQSPGVTVSLSGLPLAAPVPTEQEATPPLAKPTVDTSDPPTPPKPLTEVVDPKRAVAFLESQFAEARFDLDAVRNGEEAVPRLAAQSIPVDFADMLDIPRRKSVFVKMLLPLILMANEEILADRARLIALQEKSYPTAQDKEWLEALAKRYRASAENLPNLLHRVDVIPPSLAIAQAAVESGWGTSRFAVKGNALFGQWVWGETAQGIVPADRLEGKDHKIKAFNTPYEAVQSYARNLNRHNAYRELRKLRAEARINGGQADGSLLAGGLESYSEKGAEYVTLIRDIIRSNKLAPLDSAVLGSARS